MGRLTGFAMSAHMSVSLFVHKKRNIGHNFQSVSDRAFIFDMCTPCFETFCLVQGSINQVGIPISSIMAFINIYCSRSTLFTTQSIVANNYTVSVLPIIF